MNNTKLIDKITDIKKWSLQAYTDETLEDSLNNARKAGEAICKAIILSHYGDVHGENIILGKEKIDGTQIIKPKGELEYSDLIEKVIHENDANYIIIAHKRTRHKIKAYLEVIRTHSNPGSHDTNNLKDIIKPMDVKITRIALSILLYWLFADYLNTNIPGEVVPHINFYLEIVIEKDSITKIKEIFEQIKKNIIKFKFIDEEKIKKLEYELNLLNKKFNINNNETFILIEKIKKYNELPRKPGSADIFKKFLKDNFILEGMDILSKKLGIKL